MINTFLLKALNYARKTRLYFHEIFLYNIIYSDDFFLHNLSNII